MGLKEMADEILKNAREEAMRIEREADEKGARIIAEASEKRRRILEEAKSEAEATEKSERDEKIAATNLEAKRVVSHAKENALKNAMKDVFEATVHARDKDYKELLKRLILEGIREVGKDGVVRVNKQDHKLAHALGFKVSDEPIDCIGGALVMSPDGKLFFNNTFEARFERRKEKLRTEAYEKLFGKQGKRDEVGGG